MTQRSPEEKAAELAKQARRLGGLPMSELPSALNALIQPHIGSFRCDTAAVVANDGTVSKEYAAVVHKGHDPSGNAVPIDNVLAVVDAYDNLSVADLEQAYQRAAQIKAFEKTPPTGFGDAAAKVMTAFIVFFQNSALPLDAVSDEMAKLNKTMPSYHWPDMVAVASKGVVNYTTRVPGEGQTGDFFLPVRGYTASSAPAIYITKAFRAMGERTFNKVLSFIAARLGIYQPGIPIESFLTWVAGVPAPGISAEAYQFNLAADLQPVEGRDLVNQYLPTDTFSILVNGKKPIGSVRFQPWQDGGILIVHGNFPLELFLVCLHREVPAIQREDLGFIRRPNIQVSNVLPITEQDFLRTMRVFESGSANITVRKDSATVMVKKLADEGTRSPFYVRIMLTILRMRDAIVDPVVRDRFDKAYEPTVEALLGTRDFAKDLVDVWKVHYAKVTSGAAVTFNGNQVRITEHVDRQLKRDFESYVNNVSRVLKQCMQNLSNQFGTDIGFLFKKDGAFREGIERLRATDPVLADYLVQTRLWSDPLMRLRNEDLEHGLGIRMRVDYAVVGGVVTASEPQIRGEALTAFVERIMDRITCFVEEVTVHHLQQKLPASIAIAELPVPERPAHAPERFRLTVSPGGLPSWQLAPHTGRFEDT